MRIAVFDHQLNNGGGRRFLHNLLAALIEVDQRLDITLFCRLDEKGFGENLKALVVIGIKVKPLKSLKAVHEVQPSVARRGLRYLARKVKLVPATASTDYQENLKKEIETLSSDFDLAYFPWPYLLKAPDTRCPKVGTFHDFNFKYFFGTAIYSQDQLTFLNESIREWLGNTTAVVSTHFMKSELTRFYPQTENIHVIHLASLNMYHGHAMGKVAFRYEALLDKPYMVLPVHMTSHKNIGAVIRATYHVNRDGVQFRLIITGNCTERLKGKAKSHGLEINALDETDVIGLGYIEDQQMHYLLQNAFAVINASFYEAGNGVGLDAWPLGIPVIQSDIPAFKEHLEHQGFKAFTFDPGDDHSIAAAIEECLTNNTKRKFYIESSLEAYRNISWHITAKNYLNVFKTIVQKPAYGN